MRAVVAWRGGLFLTEGKIVVLSVSSLFLLRVGVYVCVSVCIRTHIFLGIDHFGGRFLDFKITIYDGLAVDLLFV